MIKGQLDIIRTHAQDFVIGVVTARFNEQVTSALHEGALEVLNDFGVNYFEVSVPGAVEVPMAVQWLIEYKKCDAVVALGCVVRGETPHFDYVCNAAERGCSELQLKYNVPVAFGVLTTDDGHQALARAGGAKGNKGKDSAFVALEMLALKEELSS